MSLVMLILGSLGAQTAPPVDLARIGHLPGKGRAQDAIGALAEAGPYLIPFLVSQLTVESAVEERVLDSWPRMRVGDVALVVLTDLFTEPGGETTIPGLAWDRLLERADDDTPAWELLERYIAIHGRAGLQRKVERILAPYDAGFAWDAARGCFRPIPREERK
ncbi:MAG TPA: hypothetical protein VJS92_18125 [Candidatus Polarisedimenticolaceae bacterium]|nr:hypothetical protein [Candidatus Polarisedimenticolaceae bacterium]